MSDFGPRFRALVADHRRMQDDYNALRDAGHEVDFDNPGPVWQQWYDKFIEIKDRMYQLAYDLDIPFELGGDASADDYARVWTEVQDLLGQDSNRRIGNRKTYREVPKGVTSESLADVATSNSETTRKDLS